MIGGLKVYLILGAIIAGLSFALWKTIERNAVAQAEIKAAQGELFAERQRAEKAEKASIKARLERDALSKRTNQTVTAINRSQGDACSDLPISPDIDGLLRRAFGAGDGPSGTGGAVTADPAP